MNWVIEVRSGMGWRVRGGRDLREVEDREGAVSGGETEVGGGEPG